MLERGPQAEFIPDRESILTRAILEEILEGARESLVKDQLNPALFIKLETGKRGIVPLAIPETFREKRIYFTRLGFSFRESGHNIKEAILVSEAWVVTQSEIGELDVAPSQHPHRKEAITLGGRNAENTRTVFAIQPFHRDDHNEPVFEPLLLKRFDKPVDGDSFSIGLLDNLFIQ